MQMDHIIPAGRPNLSLINKNKKQKRTCHFVDFAIPADQRAKMKENKNKFFDFVRKLKKVTVHLEGSQKA